MGVCIVPVTGRTGRKFPLEIIPGKKSYLMAVFFWALENNGYLGKSADGAIWKSVGIKDNSGLKLNFLNGFCSHG